MQSSYPVCVDTEPHDSDICHTIKKQCVLVDAAEIRAGYVVCLSSHAYVPYFVIRVAQYLGGHHVNLRMRNGVQFSTEMYDHPALHAWPFETVYHIQLSQYEEAMTALARRPVIHIQDAALIRIMEYDKQSPPEETQQ